jgi:hypothetical protein
LCTRWTTSISGWHHQSSGAVRPIGITLRTFRSPEGSNSVGLIAEIPGMAVIQQLMQSDAAANAMKADGVHGE